MCGFSFYYFSSVHFIFIYLITRHILHECKILFFINFKLTFGEDILGNGVFSCLRVFFLSRHISIVVQLQPI